MMVNPFVVSGSSLLFGLNRGDQHSFLKLLIGIHCLWQAPLRQASPELTSQGQIISSYGTWGCSQGLYGKRFNIGHIIYRII